ncbi:MAG: cytochrome c oxidase subunit II [Bacteroidota bacterium]
MFEGASNLSTGVDNVFLLIFGISAVFLLAITAVMLYFVWRYDEKRNPVPTEIHGSNTLEIVWTVIPTLLALMMFWYGWKAWIPVRHPPADSMTITVTARMWSFSFDYPNGLNNNVLLVPKGKAVRLNLHAVDINHSIFIPAFRIKQDAIPGRDNFVWFIATKEGSYNLFCTEYCGLRHSYMNAEVKVVDEATFKAWYASGPKKLSAEEAAKPGAIGRQLYEQKGCLACHSLDGTKIVGPSFKGIYGEDATVLTDGKERTVKVDDDYIKRSLLEPNADVVKGFQPNMMVSYKGQIDEKGIKDIADFIKSLNAK